MKRLVFSIFFGVGLIFLPAYAGAEVTEPLLKKLVEKGTLTQAEAEEIASKKVELPASFKGLTIGGLAYLDYSFGHNGGTTRSNFNRFTLQRGYINIIKEITPWLKARITPDIKSGASITGDYTIRMKYLYAEFLAPALPALTDIGVKAGLIQTPLSEFVESINGYRMQGAMFQDRRGLVTSSDMGLGVMGSLGGRLEKEQAERVGTSSFSGRYGTFNIGAYNGVGFGSAAENNQNKTLQGRLSVRPMPYALPGLQLAYYGAIGKGNSAEPATGRPQALSNNTGVVSFQHKYATVMAEYVSCKGSVAGDAGGAKKKNGYSIFGKAPLPGYDKVAFFARYDSFDPDRDAPEDRIKTTIAGASYRIHGANYLVAAYERTTDETKSFSDAKGQLVLQIAF